MPDEPLDPETEALREKLAGLNRMADAVAMLKSAHSDNWGLHGLQIQPYLEHVSLMLALYNALEGFTRSILVAHSEVTGQSVDEILDHFINTIAADPNLDNPGPSI